MKINRNPIPFFAIFFSSSFVLKSCTECSPPMLLSNSCSAAAHQRIHSSCKPHICPECGRSAEQPLFQTHLDETCLHFARRIGYRCVVQFTPMWLFSESVSYCYIQTNEYGHVCLVSLPFNTSFSLCRCSSCLVVFGGLNSVKSHIQQAHCDVFHKCPSCPMAFKSALSVQNHITAQHPTHTEGKTMYVYKTHTHRQKWYLLHGKIKLCFSKLTQVLSLYRLIFKCVMCDTVFTNKTLLYVHFDNHLTNQKVHVFKCPECTKLFSQRNSLLDHFKVYACLGCRIGCIKKNCF